MDIEVFVSKVKYEQTEEASDESEEHADTLYVHFSLASETNKFIFVSLYQ
jgi:hypothetical protein